MSNKSNKQMVKRTLPAVILASLLAGCSLGGGQDAKTLDENATVPLKVMYYDTRSFFQQYGMLFSAMYPNVDVEVISTSSISYDPEKDRNEEMKTFMEEHNPDVIMLSIDQLKDLAADGRLYDLETLIGQDQYDLEGIIPGVVDYIRDLGEGKLYGLAPNFYSQAVYYNKDLFDQYGIPYPTDRMSWDELLQLAVRFPAEEGSSNRIHGLRVGYNSSLYRLANYIGSTENLSVVDNDNNQVTINTEAWKQVFETARNALSSGTLYVEEPYQPATSSTYEDFLLSDPFISGKIAMVIDGHYLYTKIKEVRETLQDKGVQNWDLVTVPVDPKTPDFSNDMRVHQLFAVNANAENVQAAWDFIKYIHSEEYARIASKGGNSGNLPIRTRYINDDEGRNIEAFYSLKPHQSAMYRDFSNIPQSFYMQFEGMAESELQSVMDGSLTLPEALENIQFSGQEMLINLQNAEQK